MQSFTVQQLLVDPFLQRDLLDFGNTASQHSSQGDGKVSISCAVGYSNNLYIGSSDGQILWYTIDSGSRHVSSNAQGIEHKTGAFNLRNKHTLSPRRPIEKILLAPKVGKAIILSDQTLTFLALPTLETLVTNPIPPLRNISYVTIDDQEIAWKPEEEELAQAQAQVGSVAGVGVKGLDIGMCVVRRKAIGLYRLGAKLVFLRDVPVPETPTQAVRSNATLCISDPSKYCIVDLLGPHLLEVLPISQASPDAPADVNPAIAVLPSEPEFLFASFTGEESGSMGVFVNREGDPVRGTMSWDSHPRCIVIEGDAVIALCRDNTLRIHSIADITSGFDNPPQRISLVPDSSKSAAGHSLPLGMSINPYGLVVPNPKRDALMTLVSWRIKSDHPTLLGSEDLDTVEQQKSPQQAPIETHSISSASAFSPPATPESQPASQHVSHVKSTSSTASLSICETLIWTGDTVKVLASDSWVVKANDILIKDTPEASDRVSKIVEEERKKAKRGEVDGDRAAHTSDMRFMYARLAYIRLRAALFDDAGSLFQKSKLDPRFVVALFPKYAGLSIPDDQELVIWRGLLDDLKQVKSVDEIVKNKVSEIYGLDNPAAVDQQSAEVKQISEQLLDHAVRMLLDYLRKTRHSRRKAGSALQSSSARKDTVKEHLIDQAIDTCLCKILAEQKETEELLGILDGSQACIMNELEPFINAEEQPGLLAQLMSMLGDHSRVLEIITSMVDRGSRSPQIPDPIQRVEYVLQQIQDVSLIRKYGLWLAKHDSEKALRGLATRVKFDDRALLSELQPISHAAANQYLEYTVVRKRSPDKTLHNALLNYYLDQAEEFLADDGVMYHFTEIYDEYVRIRPNVTYCQYIAETAYDSPAKTLRMKTILFLQGSPFYDLVEAEKRLQSIDKLFYEKAIVYGRLERHDKALHLLAIRMRDSVSAETYCSQGGVVVPPKIARAIGTRMHDLEPWVALGEVGRRRKGTIEGEQRERLVMALLKVYMEDGSQAKNQTRALLNAQALHLDTIEVIDMIPPDWSVASMSDFFTRAMKRQLHDRATWRIIKAISAGQNSAIAEEYARTVGTQLPTLKTRPTDSPSGYTLPDEGSIAATEYGSMHEKSPVHRPVQSPARGEKEIQVKTEVSKENTSPVLDLTQEVEGRDLPSN
ncbi:hypothetical protein NCC49_004285 [Naganishia albida]|nr:hypothetical protein NCC49_004285 [Naganishia albida]